MTPVMPRRWCPSWRHRSLASAAASGSGVGVGEEAQGQKSPCEEIFELYGCLTTSCVTPMANNVANHRSEAGKAGGRKLLNLNNSFKEPLSYRREYNRPSMFTWITEWAKNAISV